VTLHTVVIGDVSASGDSCSSCRKEFFIDQLGFVDERPYCFRCFGKAEAEANAASLRRDRADLIREEREAEEALEEAPASSRIEEVAALHAQGVSNRGIAKELSIPRTTINRLVKRIERRKRRGQPL
jgi:DNA-directed RNA polymerase specialized sigma24 family protein